MKFFIVSVIGHVSRMRNLDATCIQISCTKFLVRVSRTRNLDRLPSALPGVTCADVSAVGLLSRNLGTVVDIFFLS